ncbi:MAG: hypothetical protein ACXAD7_26640 [Candidatus Kariarchaeaceae archaeon]|jgi:hypothetical protein
MTSEWADSELFKIILNYSNDFEKRNVLLRLLGGIQIDWKNDSVWFFYELDGTIAPKVYINRYIRVANRKAYTCWEGDQRCRWCYFISSRRPFFVEKSYNGLGKRGKSYFKQKGMRKQFSMWMKKELGEVKGHLKP